MQTTLGDSAAPLDARRLIERVRGEYLEMPGLILTTREAQRLWGLDRAQCDALMRTLIDAGFLRYTGRAYVRAGA
jgi:hypothetical protein